MRLTVKLLRRKSEHNDGNLSSLEEIALHQLEIEKIEAINENCPRLKILLMQNNIITKIENINRLKDLQYLNLSLNNIFLIENLNRCEQLQKLDLSLNFIDLGHFQQSMENLRENTKLEQLYLMGNPCCDWDKARMMVIAHIPWLESFDGQEIKALERGIAALKKDTIINELGHILLCPPTRHGGKGDKEGLMHTPENRTKMHRSLAAEREEREKRDKTSNHIQNEIPSPLRDDGTVRQCNQARLPLVIDDTPDFLMVTLAVPRYLRTRDIQIDIQPQWLRVITKGKLFQLHLNRTFSIDLASVTRATTTGELKISLPSSPYVTEC